MAPNRCGWSASTQEARGVRTVHGDGWQNCAPDPVDDGPPPQAVVVLEGQQVDVEDARVHGAMIAVSREVAGHDP